MSDNSYMIWLIATAVMVIIVLTVGTLAAANLLGRDQERTTRPPRSNETASGDDGGERTADHDVDSVRARSSSGSRR